MIALFLASLFGAALFFVAGASAMALRHRTALDAQHAHLVHQRDAAIADASRLRHTLERAAASDFEDRSTIVQSDAEVTMLRARVEHAESLAKNMAALRSRAEAAEAALEPLRKSEQLLRAELDRARRDAKVASAGTEQRAADVEKLRKDLAAANVTVQELRGAADREHRDLERARTEATALRGEIDQLEGRLRDAERQLAERTQSIRDLSAENEQLKGRLGDAEALRADYVRLRTAATETAFLKSEVARLEGELRAVKVEALGGQRRRPARGSTRQLTQPSRSIGESLSGVIERFSEAGTRSVAIADPAGFPLAATGDDGQALAAYAPLLLEAASRASQILPVGTPSTVEIIDDHGARISVWTFAVDTERLLLANLAVAPADAARVEAALSEAAAILAPAPLKTTATP